MKENYRLLKIILLTIGGLLPALMAVCQSETKLEGTWKGTSLCRLKNGPCHDEQVVYHISKDGKQGVIAVQMNKLVSGQEEIMGTVNCSWEENTQSLKGTTYTRNNKLVSWLFRLSGKELRGTLRDDAGEIIRDIHVKRDAD